jgi:hypothetical protein
VRQVRLGLLEEAGSSLSGGRCAMRPDSMISLPWSAGVISSRRKVIITGIRGGLGGGRRRRLIETDRVLGLLEETRSSLPSGRCTRKKDRPR